jgi:hypothetical protein
MDPSVLILKASKSQKKSNIKTKFLLALFSHTQKLLNFKCYTNEQRSSKYTNQTVKPCLKCLCLYIIRYQSRDAIYPILKGSGFVKR